MSPEEIKKLIKAFKTISEVFDANIDEITDCFVGVLISEEEASQIKNFKN